MTDRPDLRHLLPDDVGAEELARLTRVHELLLGAAAPAELPPRLETAPATPARAGARVVSLAQVRRNWRAVAVVAAAAAAVLFGVGFASGWATRDTGFQSAFGPIPMVGAGTTQNASARIWVGAKDAALNWPSVMKVQGLPALAKGGYYALYLTDGTTGERVLLCTVFAVHHGTTTVTFNFPGPAQGAGWQIVPERVGADDPSAKAVLWTTHESSGTA